MELKFNDPFMGGEQVVKVFARSRFRYDAVGGNKTGTLYFGYLDGQKVSVWDYDEGMERIIPLLRPLN